jgi:NADH-quinone oxidoreductase subunit G
LPPGWRGTRSVDGPCGYVFNPTIEGIEDADAILIIGSNPRREAAVLNARIRKRWRMGELPIGLIGEAGRSALWHEYLGAGPDTLKELVDGTNKFTAKLKRAKKPMIIIGQGALARGDGAGVLASAAKLAEAVGAVKGDWNGFAVLHTAAARVGGLDLGFVPGEGGLDAGKPC